jgi:nucleoside-diphosphate-sugar epimerase
VGRLGCVVVSGAAGALNLGLQVGQALLEPQLELLLTGEVGAVMMTELRGASNAKAKRELGWSPSHPSWRQGFRDLMTTGGTLSQEVK